MQIGSKYSEEKLYSGIKYYNSLPHTAEDIHELADITAAKNKYLFSNILGSGIVNDLSFSISSRGISLNEPAAINIEGDLVLVKDNTYETVSTIASLAQLQAKADSQKSGVVCILGWYQHVTANSKLKSYGGVTNKLLENDLVYAPLGIQVSTRYQFRWDTIIVKDASSFNVLYTVREEDDTLSSRGIQLDSRYMEKDGDIYRYQSSLLPAHAIGGFYIIPLATYKLSDDLNSIVEVSQYKKASAGNKILESTTEPAGNHPSGTVWYNPNTFEFKTYIEGTGFVGNVSQIGFIQYNQNITMTLDRPTPVNVEYVITQYQKGDILQVSYEGLLLNPENYEIYEDTAGNGVLRLLSFTTEVGEVLSITGTRIVDASDVTILATQITSHMSKKASPTEEAHVKLVDEINEEYNETEGYAATPKAVYESKIMTDSSTGSRYKFGVENGLVYIEEIE